MAIKALLFDTDGTLTSFWDYWHPAYKQAAKLVADTLGQPELEVKLLEAGGMDVQDNSLDPFGALATGSPTEIIELWSNQVDMMEKPKVTGLLGSFFLDLKRQQPPATTNLAILFQRLRFQGLKIGVAGSEKKAEIQRLLAHYKADKFVDFYAGTDSGFGNKFDSGMIAAFSKAVQRPLTEIAVIGDSTTDMEDAKGSGAAKAVAVLTGSASRAILEPISDVVLTDIGAIETVLQGEEDQS